MSSKVLRSGGKSGKLLREMNFQKRQTNNFGNQIESKTQGCFSKSTLSSNAVAELKAKSYHYQNVSNSYHEAYFYAKNSDYERWQLDVVANCFSPLHRQRLSQLQVVDIGGGTGRFAGLIRSRLSLNRPVICVDMSADMLKEAEQEDGVIPHLADAVSYAKSMHPESVDFALNKELIHHLKMSEEVTEFYKGLYKGLRYGGKSVTITRPQKNISYPFFEEARQVWIKNAHASVDIEKIMIDCRFSNVKLETKEYPVTMSLNQWTNMVKGRMWSTFSHFSDDDLHAGVKEIESRFNSDSGLVTFHERLNIIQGEKL